MILCILLIYQPHPLLHLNETVLVCKCSKCFLFLTETACFGIREKKINKYGMLKNSKMALSMFAIIGNEKNLKSHLLKLEFCEITLRSKCENSNRNQGGLLGCGGLASTNVGHDVVNPEVPVLQRSVHQVDGQLAFPWLTFDLRTLLRTLHLCHQRSILHVVPEQHGGLL